MERSWKDVRKAISSSVSLLILRFIQTDLPSLRSDLSTKLTDVNEDITNLSKKQKFLEGRFIEAQGHLRDVMSKRE